MGWLLRNNCYRRVAAAALLLFLSLPSFAVAIDTNVNTLQSSDERSCLWELPLTGKPTCDLLISDESGGSVSAESSYRDDDADAKVDDPDGFGITLKGSKEQAAVLCNVKCFRADPVCGEDAITYWCGAAEAKCAGVEVAYKGYCDSRSGGAGKDGTKAGQSLFLVHLIWLVLAGFLVVADVV